MKLLRYISIIVFSLLAYVAEAQHVSVKAPSRVAAGENFNVAYVINTSEVEEFRCGAFPSGLEVVAGPYRSSMSSFQIVNGHTSGSSVSTFTYTVYAEKNGTFTIPACQAVVDGRRIASKPVRITVSGHAQGRNYQGNNNGYDDGLRMKSAGSHIGSDELFIRVTASKKRVHEQEPVLLTYKVYTLVELTQMEGKMPDITGCHTQELDRPQQRVYHTEYINGRPYKCVTWSQYMVYPQTTGKLTIPSITFHGTVVQANRNVDPTEAFLNGGSGYVDVKKDIVAPSITLQVDPLPNRPANFSGGVGKFNISATLNKTDMKAGEPVTMRVVIGGVGNLKLIKQPVVQFPKNFDKYDAKITDRTRLTGKGVEGNMIYDFMAVPQQQGKYDIPAVEFTYYDVDQNKYKTIRTKPFHLNVEKGDGTRSSADYSQKNTDIRPIITGKSSLRQPGDFFFGSFGYWTSLLVPLIAFVSLLIIFRKRALENSDLVKARSNRASKVATKRLTEAHKLMLQGKQSAFYDEVLRALWGYAGDKLNMQSETLSRENIQQNLENLHIDATTITNFVSAIDECEYERYAPGDAQGNMNKTFESAMLAIMNIENSLHPQHKKSHATLLLLALLMFLPMTASAVTKQNADDEYAKGNYQQAIKDYEELLGNGVSAEIYYNLGNAYYRMENIPQAVLAYERALQLDPGNSDIRFNLDFVRAKTIDKVPQESQLVLVTWYQNLVNFTSIDNWAKTAIIAIILALVLVLMFLFAPEIRYRKIGFFGALIFFVVFLGSNFFAWQQKRNVESKSGAIVISPSVSVKKTPAASSAEEFVIHEGTKVYVLDNTMHDWREIRLDDGRQGWLMTRQIEQI